MGTLPRKEFTTKQVEGVRFGFFTEEEVSAACSDGSAATAPRRPTRDLTLPAAHRRSLS
jgi:hypothetical protein